MIITDYLRNTTPALYQQLQKTYSFLKRRTNPVIFGDPLSAPASVMMGGDRGTPIDRFYIERFLKKSISSNAGRTNSDAVVMEIAESTYSKRYFPSASTYHILTYDATQNRKGIIVGDLTNTATLPKEEIDYFICTQTLNFIYDVKAAIHGIRYVLKDHGTAFITVSGISQNSPYDYPRWGDFWRFTDLSIKRLFEEEFGNKNISVEVYGNLTAAVAFLQGFSLEDIPDRKILLKRDPLFPVTIGVIAKKEASL